MLLLLCYLRTWTNICAQNGSWLDLAANSTSIPNDKHAVDDVIEHLREIAEWEKPADLKVVALVFYGRRRFVQILDCYLKRNLVENGGMLDEVIFVAKTKDKDDLSYLEQLIQTSDKYSADYPPYREGIDFSQMYGAVERGNIYVKIDDDVLFIKDSTIRSMIKKKIEHPEWLMVSANLVVQHALSWVHQHTTAIHPYLPDLSPTSNITASWRVSDLPYWTGPDNVSLTDFTVEKGHRWLPLQPGSPWLDNTPMDRSEYMNADSGWNNWMVGAQQHYSFLQNLEERELWRYAFDTWDAEYNRVGINLITMTGDDLVDMDMSKYDVDEWYITMKYSKQTKRHVVIDGNGLAVHHAYSSMINKDGNPDIEDTDILDRYRLYAKENICTL